MINIDQGKCIGCSLCVKECLISQAIELVNGKAMVKIGHCLDCGHCIAVCPAKAVSSDQAEMEEVMEYETSVFAVDGDNFLNRIKFRRTIRHFQTKPVEREKLAKMIEAGRYTPTAVNRQPLRYIVVEQEKKQYVEMLVQTLYDEAGRLKELGQENMYTQLWTQMKQQWEVGKDLLYYDAPIALIIVTGNTAGARVDVDGALAAANIEMMANLQGLGVCINGFAIAAAEINPKIYEFLGVKENERVVTTLAIGYPAVKFRRTVPRKPAKVDWR